MRPSFQAPYQALIWKFYWGSQASSNETVDVALGVHVMLQNLMHLDLLSLHSSGLRIHRTVSAPPCSYSRGSTCCKGLTPPRGAPLNAKASATMRIGGSSCWGWPRVPRPIADGGLCSEASAEEGAQVDDAHGGYERCCSWSEICHVFSQVSNIRSIGCQKIRL
jgi:hypothetical protein